MCAATARAFSAQVRALLTRAGRESGGVLGVGGGDCWAMEMERLFTVGGGWELAESEVGGLWGL